jgi:hypothetical protein
MAREQKVSIEIQVLNRGKHGHAEEKTGKEEGKNDLPAANRTSARTPANPALPRAVEDENSLQD